MWPRVSLGHSNLTQKFNSCLTLLYNDGRSNRNKWMQMQYGGMTKTLRECSLGILSFVEVCSRFAKWVNFFPDKPCGILQRVHFLYIFSSGTYFICINCMILCLSLYLCVVFSADGNEPSRLEKRRPNQDLRYINGDRSVENVNFTSDLIGPRNKKWTCIDIKACWFAN